MRIAVITGSAGSERAQALESALAGAGADVERLDLSTPAGGTPLEQMAEALRLAEAAFGERHPDAVVLTDDDDPALAAALVATKLELPLYRLELSEGTNAPIDQLLADATVPADPVQAARAIADALAATTEPRDRA